MRPSKKCFGHCKVVFWPLFGTCSGHFDTKNGYFDVFSMFFDDFARSQLLGSVSGACRGAQKSKKIEIAKNQLKHPQSSVGWHIKGSKGRLSGLGYHMSQSIFPDFRRFLRVGGRIWHIWHTNIKSMIWSISFFWKIFGGPQKSKKKKILRSCDFF